MNALAALLLSAGSVAQVPAVARVPAAAPALGEVWRGSFGATPGAFAAKLSPGPDHEAEGPPAIAAAGEGFALLDHLRAVVTLHDAAGAIVRTLSLAGLGEEAGSAVDLAVDDQLRVALHLSRGAGAVAIVEPSGAVAVRAALDPQRSPATGLAFDGGQLFAGFADARSWQPLRPLEPVRPGLPSAGGDCNGALLGDGSAIARCHLRDGSLREIRLQQNGTPIAAVEAVQADAQGAVSAVIALRAAPGVLRRLAVRVDQGGGESWLDLGPDAPWFVHKGVAFARDGGVLRLSGDAQGPRVLRGRLAP